MIMHYLDYFIDLLFDYVITMLPANDFFTGRLIAFIFDSQAPG